MSQDRYDVEVPAEHSKGASTRSAVEQLDGIFAEARDVLKRMETTLNAAMTVPWSLDGPVTTLQGMRDDLADIQQRLGEQLLAALISGHRDEVAELCLEWQNESFRDLACSLQMRCGDESSATSDLISKAVDEDVAEENPIHEDEARVEPKRGRTISTIERDEHAVRSQPLVSVHDLAKPARSGELSQRAVREPSVDLNHVDLSQLFSDGKGMTDDIASQYVASKADLAWLQNWMRLMPVLPRRCEKMDQVEPFVSALTRTTTDSSLDRIAALPKDWHWLVTAFIMAYVRHVQVLLQNTTVRTPEHASQEARIREVIGRLTNFSRATQPGTIPAFRAMADPTIGDTWYDTYTTRRMGVLEQLEDEQDETLDAPTPSKKSQQADTLRQICECASSEFFRIDDLVRLVESALALDVPPGHTQLLNALSDFEDELAGHESLKDVVRSLRERRETACETKDSGAADLLDASWPFFSHTRGKKAAVIGGHRKSEGEERLMHAFGFDKVDWFESYEGNTARQGAFADRLTNGHYDVVILLQRFIGHRWSNMAFENKPEGTTVVLSHSYGVDSVRRALEHWFGG